MLHRAVSLDLQPLHLNALLKARNILPHNAAGERGQAIRRSASNGERQASLKWEISCSSKGQSSQRRITTADGGFSLHRSGPGVNCRLVMFSNTDDAAIAEADGGGVRAQVE